MSGVPRLEGNNIAFCVIGIDVDGTNNLILRNSVRGSTTNDDIVPGNTAGPIVTSAGIATDSNPHANYEF